MSSSSTSFLPGNNTKASDVNTFSSEKTLSTSPELFQYLDKYGRKQYSAVQSLRESTLIKRHSTVGLMLEPTTCSLLEHQLRSINGLRVLEVGVFTGVTSLALTLNVVDTYRRLVKEKKIISPNGEELPNVLKGLAQSITENQAKAARIAAGYEENTTLTDADVMLYDSDATLTFVTKFQEQHTSAHPDVPLPLVFGIDLDNNVIKEVALEHFDEKTKTLGSPYVFLAGNAKDIITKLSNDPVYQGTFDFVFIDADKPGYEHYYEESVKLVKSVTGLITLDNVLWKGSVAKYLDEDLAKSTLENRNEGKLDRSEANCFALHKVNERIAADNRTDSITLPIGDGLTIARKL